MELDDNFASGALLRFDPFWFPDGGQPKSKYFVVLYKGEDSLLLASLPTSKDHVPSDVSFRAGCIELPERNFNAFVFPAHDFVTDKFAFPRNTFIYGSSIHSYNLEAIKLPVENSLSTITMIGTIRSDLFAELINCLKKSDSVRKKYKRLLGD